MKRKEDNMLNIGTGVVDIVDIDKLGDKKGKKTNITSSTMMVDTPAGVSLNSIEQDILMSLVEGKTQSGISRAMGIPSHAIASLLRRQGVRDYLEELKDARREALLSFATNVVADTLEDKLRIIAEDDEKSLGSTTRKDHIEIAKTLAEMLKGSSKASEDDNPMVKIYQQIGALNGNT